MSARWPAAPAAPSAATLAAASGPALPPAHPHRASPAPKLWDLHLKAVWQRRWDVGSSEGEGAAAAAAAALDAAASAVEQLGSQFFPNESSFPGGWAAVAVIGVVAGVMRGQALHQCCGLRAASAGNASAAAGLLPTATLHPA